MKPGAVQIGRNEPCPCGSGKRYMDCCLNTKYLITYNFKNKAVLIDKNEINKNLRRIITLNSSLNRFRKKPFQDTNIKLDYGLEYLKRVYEIVDLSLKEVEKFASCSKGCSACCNKQPTTTWIEAEYIKKNLKEKLGNLQEYEIVKSLQEDSYDKICPFLSKSGECSVYDYRPLKCRSYLVFTDPKDCSDENKESLRFSDAILDMASNTVKKITLFLGNEDASILDKNLSFWLHNTV